MGLPLNHHPFIDGMFHPSEPPYEPTTTAVPVPTGSPLQLGTSGALGNVPCLRWSGEVSPRFHRGFLMTTSGWWNFPWIFFVTFRVEFPWNFRIYLSLLPAGCCLSSNQKIQVVSHNLQETFSCNLKGVFMYQAWELTTPAPRQPLGPKIIKITQFPHCLWRSFFLCSNRLM